MYQVSNHGSTARRVSGSSTGWFDVHLPPPTALFDCPLSVAPRLWVHVGRQPVKEVVKVLRGGQCSPCGDNLGVFRVPRGNRTTSKNILSWPCRGHRCAKIHPQPLDPWQSPVLLGVFERRSGHDQLFVERRAHPQPPEKARRSEPGARISAAAENCHGGRLLGEAILLGLLALTSVIWMSPLVPCLLIHTVQRKGRSAYFSLNDTQAVHHSLSTLLAQYG